MRWTVEFSDEVRDWYLALTPTGKATADRIIERLACTGNLLRMPHSRSLETTEDIEEERRLLYVGITRARKRAYLSWARVRAMYGREIYQIPSGFLNEIGD